MFRPGQIVEFIDHDSGSLLDGVVWRVLKEDETNFSVLIRFVNEVIK